MVAGARVATPARKGLVESGVAGHTRGNVETRKPHTYSDETLENKGPDSTVTVISASDRLPFQSDSIRLDSSDSGPFVLGHGHCVVRNFLKPVISRIEPAAASPTAAMISKLADVLDMELSLIPQYWSRWQRRGNN